MKESNLEYFDEFHKVNQTNKIINNTVWAYTRVSTKEQLANFSLANQKKQIEDYAKLKGFKITEYFGNTYESAKSDFERKEFKRMMDEAKSVKDKPYAILFSKLNRLSRTGGGAIAIYDQLTRELGIKVIETINDLQSDNNINNFQMLETLLSASKENYSKLESTVPGMQSLIKSGDILGKCPRGYDHYGPRVKDISRIRGEQKLVVNDEGKQFRKAWFWKLDGLRDVDILKRLEIQGVKVTKQFLSDMWRKPFYCGININKIYHRAVPGNWEPLVSQEHFKKVQQIINQNHQGYKQEKQNEMFPLSTKLYCQKCEGKMTHYPNKTKNQNYYKCNSCKGMNINAKKVHADFIKCLDEVQLIPELEKPFKMKLKEVFNNNNKSSIEREKELRKNLSELEKKFDVLEERHVFNEITAEQYQRFNSKLIKTKNLIINELEDVDFKKSNLSLFIKKALKISKNISYYWSKNNLDIRKRIQDLVFPEKIFLSSAKDKYLTNKLSPIFSLISLIPNTYAYKEKGLLVINYKKSSVVAGTGLEPATFGL